MSVAPYEQMRKEAMTWLVVSAVSAVACNGWCLSVAGAILCFLALQAADRGDAADAAAKLRWGKILTLIGVALGLLLGLALLLYFLLNMAIVHG